MDDVFVIGAGCSVPYGFPTGAQLMQELKDWNYKSNEKDHKDPTHYLLSLYPEKTDLVSFYGTWQARGIEALNSSVVIDFANTIKNSVMISTDEFLKNRLEDENKDLIDFGKRLIAYRILYYEHKSETLRRNQTIQNLATELNGINTIDWIQHFLSRVDQSRDWKQKLLDSVFFIFNYDRVFEKMLFNYMTCDKQKSSEETLAFIDELKIIHVNGYIGKLKDVPYGQEKDISYKEISKKMETVWEKLKNHNRANEIDEYKIYVEKAEKIYFLGFSYLYENLKSIGIDREGAILKNKEIYGSAFGLSSQNTKRINEYLNIDLGDRQCRMLKDAKAVDIILDHYII